MRTKDRLARELLATAAKAGPGHQKIYTALADRAVMGEFDDYSNAHMCGPTALHRELMDAGLDKFARRVANGEFDATMEESNEWIGSPDGQAALAYLPAELRAKLEAK